MMEKKDVEGEGPAILSSSSLVLQPFITKLGKKYCY